MKYNSSLLIIGTGGLSKEVLNSAHTQYKEIAFLSKERECSKISDFNVLCEQDISSEYIQKNFDEVIIAIGDNSIRLKLTHHYNKMGIKLATIIHPRATVSEFSIIDPGSIVCENSLIGPYTTLGIACLIGPGCIVCHDCKLADGVRLSPKAAIGGMCNVGEKSWLCMGSTVSNNITIGQNCIIGAGAVVLNNAPDKALLAGIPAKIKKYYV